MTDKDSMSSCIQKESFEHIRKRHKPLVVKDIQAEALRERQTIAGFIEKKCDNNHWKKYWFVLHEGTLYCYLTANDSVTIDAVNLYDYSVTMLVDKIKGKIFVLQLSHEKFTSIYLSLVSREQMECWYECLVKVSGVMIQTDHQQDYDACEDVNDISFEVKTRLVKQKLLEEMLRQKRELEKKQAERLQKTHSQGTESPDRSPSSPSSPDISSDERRTSDMTRLQQRRISTLLKLESIQKQLEKPVVVKKGFFGFGKTKKPDEHKNVHLQEQLKELKEQCKKLEIDLNHVGHSKNAENIDVNQNRESIPDSTFSLLVNRTEQTPDSEDDEVKRTGVVKSRMKKSTNKAFYKDKLKKKSPVSLKQMNGSLPNLCEYTNDDARSGGGFDNVDGRCIYSEGVNKLNFSAMDLTRPSGNLKLELNSKSNENNHHLISPTPAQCNNTNNRRGTVSSLPSPRSREIAPAVLAEIDAFEEMTRKFLNPDQWNFRQNEK